MKKISYLFIIMVLMCTPFLSASVKAEENHPPRLVDHSDLLSSSEEEWISDKLDEVSRKQNFDVVIVTVDSLQGKSAMEYADDFYDYNGYGMGNHYDGVLLLVSMYERQWWISTYGYGITAITEAGIDYISQQFLSDLSNGDYARAFYTYVSLCDEFVAQAKTGTPYDVGNLPKEPFPFLMALLISLGVGFLIAFIVVSCMKAQLKTVHYQSNSRQYIKQGSMQLTRQYDQFLYANISKRRKPEQKQSGGGSSTHGSSSGRSHGGSGGGF